MSVEYARCDSRIGVHIWMHKTATVCGRLMGIWGCLHCGQIDTIGEMPA